MSSVLQYAYTMYIEGVMHTVYIEGAGRGFPSTESLINESWSPHMATEVAAARCTAPRKYVWLLIH